MTDLLFDENDKVGFNSTLVQLKAMAVTGPGYIIHCFNSTLVQLKAVGFALPDGVDFRFQFYLSSIKRFGD